MVRCANRSRRVIRVPRIRLRAQPTISPGSLHAPYGLLPLLAVGKVMIKAGEDLSKNNSANLLHP